MSSDKRDDRGKDRGSRDRGRPNETNKNDSKSIRCRVFVGNLNTDQLSRMEFEEMFSKHGHIIGCSIHNGYGFVQYEKESGADEAVLKRHGTMIKDKRVDVNLAGERRKPDKDKRPTLPMRGGGRGRPSGLEGPRSPSPPGNRDVKYPSGMPAYRDENYRDDLRDPLDRDDRGPPGPPLKRSPYPLPRDDYPRADPYGHRPPLDDLPPKRMKPDYDYPPPPKPVEAPIDCEIIIINKQQRGYADIVEKKLKAHGLVVECAHLPETVTMADELEDAIRRGVLYGIIISSQHEVHHSVTVHILHGTQQEHRNMPLEDAIKLVSRNFEMYMQTLRERERVREQEHPVSVDPIDGKGYGTSSQPSSVAPPVYSSEASQLLNMAADGKYLTANQYTQLINELTKLRDEQLKQEGRSLPVSTGSSAKAFAADPQSIALQQAELQAKILSILNPNNSAKAAGSSVTGNSDTSHGSSSTVAEDKPAVKIPVLTPSYSASTAFKAPSSTAPSQATAGPNKVLGMALSTLRGGVDQSGTSTQYPSSVYSRSSYTVASGAPAVRSVQPVQTWSQGQYRVPTVSIPSQVPRTIASYGVSGQYSSRGQYASGGQYGSTVNTGYRPVHNSYQARY